jgi:carboxyl-terminal processing protease
VRRVAPTLTVAVLLAGAFALGYELSAHTRAHAAAPAPTPSVVAEVRAELAARYYRAVPPAVLDAASVSSMLALLKDPYTEYLTAPAYQLLRQETSARYSGIGATLMPAPDGLLVVATQPGPARNAGIAVGDVITRVDSTPTQGLGVTGALAHILGPRGTVVELRVLRSGRTFEFAVRRAEISAPNVSGRLLSFAGRRYGYVRLASFRAGATPVLANEIKRLAAAGAKGLVLDLRENPGGLFEQAIGVSSLFLRSKDVIVSLEGAHRPREVYTSTNTPPLTRLPLVVLVDRYTASSAEIVAAALHDDHRALLVGTPTYGKAVVQTIDPLADGGALALTIARYFTPAGVDISRLGVVPDIRAQDRPGPTDDVLAVGLAALAGRSR